MRVTADELCADLCHSSWDRVRQAIAAIDAARAIGSPKAQSSASRPVQRLRWRRLDPCPKTSTRFRFVAHGAVMARLLLWELVGQNRKSPARHSSPATQLSLRVRRRQLVDARALGAHAQRKPGPTRLPFQVALACARGSSVFGLSHRQETGGTSPFCNPIENGGRRLAVAAQGISALRVTVRRDRCPGLARRYAPESGHADHREP